MSNFTDSKFSQMKRIRDFDELSALSTAVSQYNLEPCLHKFLNVAEHVTPEMNRGAHNEDGVYFSEDVVELALLYRGFKPVVSLNENPPDYYQDAGMKLIQFVRRHPELETSFPTSVRMTYRYLWKMGPFEEHVKVFTDYMRTYRGDYGEEHTRIVGRALGYPEKDIEYYVSMRQKAKQQRLQKEMPETVDAKSHEQSPEQPMEQKQVPINSRKRQYKKRPRGIVPRIVL